MSIFNFQPRDTWIIHACRAWKLSCSLDYNNFSTISYIHLMHCSQRPEAAISSHKLCWRICRRLRPWSNVDCASSTAPLSTGELPKKQVVMRYVQGLDIRLHENLRNYLWYCNQIGKHVLQELWLRVNDRSYHITAKKKGCFESIWLPQFHTSSASLSAGETHCLLYIPNSD